MKIPSPYTTSPTKPIKNLSLSPHFSKITVAEDYYNNAPEQQRVNVVKNERKYLKPPRSYGMGMMAVLPCSSQPQVFRVCQNTETIQILDNNNNNNTTDKGSVLAILEKSNRENDHNNNNNTSDEHSSLMVVRDAASGKGVAVLKKQGIPTKKEELTLGSPGTNNHLRSSNDTTLRLYGHEPLYLGQVPKRKRSYKGPPPLYRWGKLEKKSPGLLGGQTKYNLHVPTVPNEVVYTIAIGEERQPSLRRIRALSQRTLFALPLPFPGKTSNNNNNNNNASSDDDEEQEPHHHHHHHHRQDSERHFDHSNNSDDDNHPTAAARAPVESKVTCQGQDCALLRWDENDSDQALITVLPNTDPLLMILFFAATNQLSLDNRKP